MSYSQPANLVPPRAATVYETAVAISPVDNTPIGPFAALYVGGAGTVALCPRNSTTVVTFTVPAGTVLPVAIQGVNATGTTASNLVGLA